MVKIPNPNPEYIHCNDLPLRDQDAEYYFLSCDRLYVTPIGPVAEFQASCMALRVGGIEPVDAFDIMAKSIPNEICFNACDGGNYYFACSHHDGVPFRWSWPHLVHCTDANSPWVSTYNIVFVKFSLCCIRAAC